MTALFPSPKTSRPCAFCVIYAEIKAAVVSILPVFVYVEPKGFLIRDCGYICFGTSYLRVEQFIYWPWINGHNSNIKFPHKKGKLLTYIYSNNSRLLEDYIFINKKDMNSALTRKALSSFDRITESSWQRFAWVFTGIRHKQLRFHHLTRPCTPKLI